MPTLAIASMLAFALSRIAPGDQVEEYLQEDPFATISTPGDLLRAERKYTSTADDLNLDQPTFYFAITSAAYPDTLHKITIKKRKELLQKLIAQYGNWPEIECYYQSVRSTDLAVLSLPDSLVGSATEFKINLRDLYVQYLDGAIESRLGKMENILSEDGLLSSSLSSSFVELKNKYAAVKSESTTQLLKIPSFQWHGLDNQYHRWATGFLKGDFGKSIIQKRAASEIIRPALFWTLVLNLSAIIFAFAVAIPLGIWSAVKKGGHFDKITSLSLFMLYSLPVFWVGTMMLIFFTTREYGMDWFAGAWLGSLPADASFWVKIKTMYPYLLLPIICIAYPSIAFIARQARGSMSEVLGQEYIKTARAKGLSESKVIWKHGFRNALFPIITMLASIIPASIAGSITIEFIFNIPGLGLTLYKSIVEQDWPIVFAIMMLGAVLTIVGILVSDILYAMADPRVRLDKND